MYDDLLTLLRTDYGWDVEPSARPYKPTIESALAEGRSLDDIAAALTRQAERKARPPVGHAAYGDPDAEWAYKLRWTFGSSSHFSHLETEQALGYQPQDAAFKGKAGARTAEDALELMALGWDFAGQSQFVDMAQESGRAEYERRAAYAASHCPRPWSSVDPDLYLYLVVTGRLPSSIPPFGVRVSEQYDQCFGLTLQQWLDNQWCGPHIARRWFPDGSENPNNPDVKKRKEQFG
jgi:hypothetical protein